MVSTRMIEQLAQRLERSLVIVGPARRVGPFPLPVDFRVRLFERNAHGGYDHRTRRRCVQPSAYDLREEVLALSVQESARMASDLLASLDSEAVDEAEIDKLWSAETQRRAAMLEAGEAGTLPWDDIQHRFADRRVQRDA